MRLGKYFVEVDTSVTGEKVESYYFRIKEDRDARIEQLVNQFGVEVINAIGDYQCLIIIVL